jgi:hypothetical protein
LARRNRIQNNIFLDNDRPLDISDPDNVCDYNVFASSGKPFALAEWRKLTGWGEYSTTAGARHAFDPTDSDLILAPIETPPAEAPSLRR